MYHRLMFIVALMLGLSAGNALAQGGPARVVVDAVAMVDVKETQPLVARLVSLAQSEVATRIPGIVSSVAAQAGDRVAKGDTLAVLDEELLAIELEGATATVEQVKAGLAAAEAQLELARNSFNRTSQLRGSAAFSQGRAEDLQSEFSRAEAELARARAAMAVGQAALRSAQYRMENSTIRAPFDGVVLSRSADPGDYLALGETVLQLLDDKSIEIEADVPTDIVGALDRGDRVTAILDDGTALQAVVRAVIPNERPSTRTRPVRFEVGQVEASKPMAPGQSVTVMAPVSEERQALSVAKDAIVQQRGSWVVFAVVDGAVVPKRVMLGAAVANRFEVTGDLTPGELVVVRGNERLRPGQPVAFQDPRETVAAGSSEPAQ
ncbi:MAG: efflux RND transporter periplasmic adaptor subunit [Pseudomonadota bacterium]